MDLFWYKRKDGSFNFGDCIAPLILKGMGVKEVFYCRPEEKRHLLSIGSILQFATPLSTVWGSGLIKPNLIHQKPDKVLAVRGPLTHENLRVLGIFSPLIVGDPAILLPDIYPISSSSTYKYGLIPHYSDINHPWVKKCRERDDVKFIDVEGEPLSTLKGILSCEHILSSSLHGIIVAEAYGLRASWIKLSNKLFGGDFKFQDYFFSTDRKDISAHELEDSSEVSPSDIKPLTSPRDMASLRRPLRSSLESFMQSHEYSDS